MANDSLHSIQPFFIGDQNQIAFSTREMNAFARSRYIDTFGFYQQVFNIYGWMKMNQMHKFILHTPKGYPLVWQPLKACAYNETGSISVTSEELTPDPVYLKEKFCWDELFDSAFHHMLRFDENGDIMEDEEFQQIFAALVEELVANANLGARLSLTTGQLYDVDAIAYSDDNTANITDLFKRTHPTVRGWVKLFVDAANAGDSHLNTSHLDPTDFDQFGYTKSVVELFDNLRGAAPKRLRNLVNRGGIVTSRNFNFFPLFLVSPSLHARLVNEYIEQKSLVAQNMMRITVRNFGGENSATPNNVYYIDQVPVIPIDDIEGFDQFTKIDTHVAAIVASGNIQMGMSFANVPSDIEEESVAMIIEQQKSIAFNDYRAYHFLSHALMKVALADKEYAVASITSTTE